MTVPDTHLVRRFAPALLLNIPPKHERLGSLLEGATIPKIVHQTYKTSHLHPAIRESINAMRQLNPGWEYRFYDDGACADFIEKEYGPQILAYYDRINPRYGAARADLFRYLLMYKFGGVYLDVKSVAQLPLDDVIRPLDRLLLSKWPNGPAEEFAGTGLHLELAGLDGGEFQQWHIVVAPGHPLLKAVIENVLRNIDNYIPSIHGTGQAGVLRMTGPIAYTLAMAPILNRHQYRIVSQQELGLLYSVFGAQADAPPDIQARHYSRLSAPIVHISWARAIISALIAANLSIYRVVRTLGRTLRNIHRPVRPEGGST